MLVGRRITSGLLITGALVALVAPAGAAAPAPAKALYKGTITDPDGDPVTYAVTVRITTSTQRVGRPAGRITYRAAENEQTGDAPLSCKGTLSYRGRNSSAFRFREIITAGTADCLTGGTVTLTRRSARRLTYRWTKAGASRPTPTGALTR